MKILYSFRSEKKPLPNAIVLFETVRKLHNDFVSNPVTFAAKYQEWLRPMNQLRLGHFFSINWNAKDFPFEGYYNKNSNIKLEMQQIAPNFIRIQFEIQTAFPYRIDQTVRKPINKIKKRL